MLINFLGCALYRLAKFSAPFVGSRVNRAKNKLRNRAEIEVFVGRDKKFFFVQPS